MRYGNLQEWDEIAVDGDIANEACLLRYRRDRRLLAVASICRDLESLHAELGMEREAIR